MEAICQYGSFSKVGHANGGEPGNARWTAVAASFCRPGHRHLGGVGLRPLDFRIVAMEAIYLTKAGFQSRTYMEANQRNARWTATVAFAVLSRWRRSVLRGQFSEVGRKWWCRGQPSSGRWRQEHAAGEAAKRMSALSGIGAGKYESVATAAGGDDADNSSPGGFSPARHRCKRQRWGSLYKYLWRLRCESPLVRSWRRASQRSVGGTVLACMWHQLYLRTWHGLPAIR